MLKKVVDILIKFLILLTIVLGLIGLFKPALIKDFIEWVRTVILLFGNWNYLIVFITSVIESFPVLGVVVPGQNILLIVGGFFGEQSYNNLFYVIVLACIGAIIGNYSGYLLGKYYGKQFFKNYGLWFGIGETELKYLEKGAKKWGAWGIILGKFHNLTRAFIPFIAGGSGMKHRSFIIYNVIGSIIWSITIIVLGVVFAKTYEVIVDYLVYIMLGIMLTSGLYVWRFKKKEFMKYWRKKDEEMKRKYNTK